MALKRYKIAFEYLGEDFFGTQKQPDKRTVQGELEKAISTLTKSDTSIIMSGRCDVKVNAKYHTAHFDMSLNSNGPKTLNEFKYHLNCILPLDLKVIELTEVQPDFHAQKDAKYKHYRYTILNDPVASVFYKSCLHWPYIELDIDKVNQMLSYLIGYHDFSAFKSKSDNPYNDCTIYYANASKQIIERHKFIFIDIIGDRFLYNMIRIIVGDILKILRNDADLTLIKQWLCYKTRQCGINKVMGQGLCLEYVGYDNVENYIKTITKKGKINENI
ncbi:MAG: tRNA pseudouridine(38-40) synthase TruA [Candidatus Gastranaerophilales bacterium]|nr:tRNA pseudouridine(38-40) synthase TruA [bacterium]MBR2068915.1 tRNA pseudouridine(38-40) synthase TruA [Candidatus Gastranaerophilales bacterium]